MIHVILETASGELVSHEAVLPFGKPPEVVIWGARVFVHKQTFVDEDKLQVDRYREVFSAYITGEEKYTLGDLMEQKGMSRPAWTVRDEDNDAQEA